MGKGKLWRCWKDKIVEDFSIHDGKSIKCICGNLIGLDEEKCIKLKQHSFILFEYPAACCGWDGATAERR
jgi:hypothetical protein